MKFIKIETNHTKEQIDSLSASMNCVQSDKIESIYKQISYVKFVNSDGFLCVFYVIPDRLVDELVGFYTSMSINFKYEDLTRDALWRRINSSEFGLTPDEYSQLDYILEKFIDDNIDMDIILDKIFEMGEDSLTEKDKLVLQSY
jgi:hypothetical protein